MASLLLLWLLVRPQYRQALLNERVTIVSQLQEYALRAADRNIYNWLHTTNDLTGQISENPAETESILCSSIRFKSSLMRIRITSQRTNQEVDLWRRMYQDFNFSDLSNPWIKTKTEKSLFAT